MNAWEELPQFSKELYKATYFHENDDYESWSHRVSHKYANDENHGNRLKMYIQKRWFHPSTPIASDRGLPIACYVSHVGDSNESIFDSYHEGAWLGALGVVEEFTGEMLVHKVVLLVNTLKI